MTISAVDRAPSNWTRVDTTNNYLQSITTWIKEHGVAAELSGAVTNGFMDSIAGPFATRVAFEKKEDAQSFIDWMASGDMKASSAGDIFITPNFGDET